MALDLRSHRGPVAFAASFLAACGLSVAGGSPDASPDGNEAGATPPPTAPEASPPEIPDAHTTADAESDAGACGVPRITEDFTDNATSFPTVVANGGTSVSRSMSTFTTAPASLRATGSASGYAYLATVAREPLSASKSYCLTLAFAIRIEKTSTQTFDGPALIATDNADSDRRRVTFEIKPDGRLMLAQETSVSTAGATEVGRLTLGTWHRVVMSVNVDPATTAPFGTFDVTFDGIRVAGDLGVRLFANDQLILRAGISYADSDAELYLDDLRMSMTP